MPTVPPSSRRSPPSWRPSGHTAGTAHRSTSARTAPSPGPTSMSARRQPPARSRMRGCSPVTGSRCWCHRAAISWSLREPSGRPAVSRWWPMPRRASDSSAAWSGRPPRGSRWGLRRPWPRPFSCDSPPAPLEWWSVRRPRPQPRAHSNSSRPVPAVGPIHRCRSGPTTWPPSSTPRVPPGRRRPCATPTARSWPSATWSAPSSTCDPVTPSPRRSDRSCCSPPLSR